MEPDKPLHVRVAEALGWTHHDYDGKVKYCLSGGTGYWRTVDGEEFCDRCDSCPPRYDTDWSATGPLIEKFIICLAPAPRSVYDNPPWWRATPLDDCHLTQLGPTPLNAACRLILALKEAGKLA